MQSASRPRSSPSATRGAKSPGASTLLANRPPFSLYSRNNATPSRDESPTTSRHQLQRATTSPTAQQRARSPILSRHPANHSSVYTPTAQPHYPQQFRTPQMEVWSLPPTQSSVGGASGEQLELFAKLQQVVVQLTHSAADEKSKLVRMQQRLDSYEALVKDQDRMICELRSMNAKLQKEKDALSTFRHGAASHQEVETTPQQFHRQQQGQQQSFLRSLQQGPSSSTPQQLMYHQDESLAGGSAVTPKTKSFVQSLVDQLKEEKRLRYQVEEQSSRMIGEQQLTIHRLEDRLTVKGHNGGGSSPAGGRSPRASVGATARTSAHHYPILHSPGDDSQRYDASLMVEAIRAYSNPSPSDDGPSVRVTVGDDRPPSSRSMSSSDTAGASLSMENASALLQQIKLRHGL